MATHCEQAEVKSAVLTTSKGPRPESAQLTEHCVHICRLWSLYCKVTHNMSQSADDGDADASPPAADAAASRRRHRHRPRYEQLGAPTLLHRHVPSYTFDANNDHIIPPKPQWEAKAPLEIAQARSQKLEQRRHAQAQSFVADRERLGRAKMRHHAGAMLQLAGRYDEEHYRELNQSQSQSQSQLQPSIVTATKRRRRRDEALPEYCAPFGNDLVAWGWRTINSSDCW